MFEQEDLGFGAGAGLPSVQSWGLGGETSRIGLPEQEAVSTRRERAPSSSKKGITRGGH